MNCWTRSFNWLMIGDWKDQQNLQKNPKDRKAQAHFIVNTFHILHYNSLGDHMNPTSPHSGRKRLLKLQPSQEAERSREVHRCREKLRNREVKERVREFLIQQWVQKSFYPVHLHYLDRVWQTQSRLCEDKILGHNQNQWV